MASPLQVCLALLLVSCVQAQWSVDLGLLSQCANSAVSTQVTNCTNDFRSALGTSNSSDIAALFNALCTNIPAITTYRNCLKSVYETCLPAEYQGLIDSPSGAADATQYYCDHRTEINVTCVSTELISDSCFTNARNAVNTAISNQTAVVQASCTYWDAARVCALNVGTSCPNHNANVYDTYLSKQYPPACAGGAVSVPTSFLLLGACVTLLNKMAATFFF